MHNHTFFVSTRFLRTVAKGAALGLISCALLTGCSGKKTPKVTAADQQAFSNATPELAQMWQTVQAADKSNDYVKAQTVLYALSRKSLSPEQEHAVGMEMMSLKQRMDAAAEKGDPAALKAVNELRDNPPNRRPMGR